MRPFSGFSNLTKEDSIPIRSHAGITSSNAQTMSFNERDCEEIDLEDSQEKIYDAR